MDSQFSFKLSNLRGNPFDSVATADHPYLSSSFQEVLAALYYGLEYGNRILIVSAERGLGKTTLLRYLERRLRNRSRTLLLSPGRENEMLRKMLAEIGGATTSDELLTLREQLDFTLGRIGNPDKPFTLLVDCDEDETGSNQDVLWLLATLESMEKGLLRVVVASCPVVAGALRGSGLADEMLRLSSLTASEVQNYIDHRLRLVGWNGVPLFTARAYALIAAKSSGRPSTVNEICSKLLHNLPHLDGAHSTDYIEEGVLDYICVESLSPGQNLVELIPGADHLIRRPILSPNHRTTVLASIVVMMIMAIAGLWYRNGEKAHLTKHVTAAKALRSAPPLQHAAFPVVAHGQLPTASAASAKANERAN